MGGAEPSTETAMTMPFAWDARYETGLEAVDQDHRRLLELVRTLGAEAGDPSPAGEAAWRATYRALQDYARTHFHAEEALMRELQVDPRHRRAHEALHRRFFEDLATMSDAQGQPEIGARAGLVPFLSHWIQAHVLGTDHQMARQIRAIRGGGSPESAYEGLPDLTEGGGGALMASLQGLADSLATRVRNLCSLRQRLEGEISTRTRDLDRTQEALDATAARYQAAVDGSQDGFWIVEGDGRLCEVNRAYERLSGYSREELLSMRIPALEASESPEETAAHIAKVLATGSDLFETRHRRKSGEVWPAEVLVTQVPTDPGRLYVFLRDISARKGAETALGASEQRFRHLFYDAPVGHALNRLSDGSFLAVNDAFARITGYALEELNRLSYWDLTPRRYEPQEAEQLESLRSQGRYGPYEKEYIRKDGRHVPVLLNGTLVEEPDGTPVILSVVLDITEHARSRRIKDEFISLVSHELRTPLTSIRGGVGLALSGGLGALPPKVEEVLRLAQSNCDRLTLIINDLLDIQRMEQGLLELTVQPVALGALLAQVVQEQEAFARLHEVRLHLVDASEGALVATDPARFAQIAMNLLSNAVKFSPAGGEVVARLLRSGEGLELQVEDHGDGIPEAFRPRVFEKFAQASEANVRQRGGSGLGLSIVRALVDRLGGRVGFDTETGRGTTFHVWLPLDPSLSGS